MQKLILLLLMFILFFVTKLFSCTVVNYADKNVCLVGNNEDNFMPYTQALFLPAEQGKYGRVFFGYYPNNCTDFGNKQGGMNEKGLFFDGLSLPPKPVLKSVNKPTYMGLIMEKVLEECSTVEEAIKLIEKYNLAILATGQIFIADRTGNAVIIEGDTIIRKKGNWLAATNFRHSEVKNNQFPCDRYNKVKEMLETTSKCNVENMKDILNSVHQEGTGPTIYSNIYDLKSNEIFVYHFHDFENVVKLSLMDELKKGKHTLILADLFTSNPSYVNFEQTKRKDFDNLNESRQKLHESFQLELTEKGEFEADINAVKIFNNYSKATGGKRGRDYIKTLISNGDITSKLVIGSYVAEYSGKFISYKNNKGQCFQQIDLSGLIIIENATDGKNSWKRSSYESYKFLKDFQEDEFALDALIESNYLDLFKKTTYLGEFEIEGNICHKVLCETNSGFQVAKYFDKVSGLQRAQLSIINHPFDGPTKTWTTFDNYHNRMMFPNNIKVSITTQSPFAIQTSLLNIDLIHILNPPIDENLFKEPII